MEILRDRSSLPTRIQQNNFFVNDCQIAHTV
jgi:hypothetical protein